MITEEWHQSIQAVPDHEEEAALTSPAKDVRLLSEAGLLKITLPGEALSFSLNKTPQLLQWLKAVGRKDLSLGRLYEGHVNALLLIHLYATAQQKEKWFADAERGYLFGVWNTGTSELLSIHLQDENDFVLSGKKTFASGAGIVKRALVTGTLNHDGKEAWQMCIINGDELPEDAIDDESWKPMGMKNSLSYTVDFTGYTGSRWELLGNGNDYYQQPFFSAGAIRFCAVQLGGAEAIYNHTTAYLKTLRRTEDPFQQMRIAQMATELTSSDLWIQQAATNWDNWNDDAAQKDKLIAFANMTRIAVERTCLQVIELASQCVGARGLMESLSIEQKIRDLQFYLRQPAPDAAVTDVSKYMIASSHNIEAVWHEDKGLE